LRLGHKGLQTIRKPVYRRFIRAIDHVADSRFVLITTTHVLDTPYLVFGGFPPTAGCAAMAMQKMICVRTL
jgi:hypothetical protein